MRVIKMVGVRSWCFAGIAVAMLNPAMAAVVTTAQTSGTIQIGTALPVPYSGNGSESTNMLVDEVDTIGIDTTTGQGQIKTFADSLANVQSTGAGFGISVVSIGSTIVDFTTTVRQTISNDTGGDAYFRWTYEILPGFVNLINYPGADVSGFFEWNILIDGVSVTAGSGLSQIINGTGSPTSLSGDANSLAGLVVSGTDISWGRSEGAIDLGLFHPDTVVNIEYLVHVVATGDTVCDQFNCSRSAVSFDDPPGGRFVMRVAPPQTSPFSPPGNEFEFYDSVVPVPAAVWMFGSAIGVLGCLKRRAVKA